MRHNLTSTDLRLLTALPRDLDPGRWLTPADVSNRLSVAPDVARSVLVRLRARGLVLDDGERPQRFARMARADVLLEHTT
jgi:DNA-binding GntR family transcriptional regulator